MSAMPQGMVMPTFIQLIPPSGESMEGWFKEGGADAITDRLLADGKTKPCIITTSKLEFMNQGDQSPTIKVHTLKASDFPTWPQRRRALFRLLTSLNKE